MMSCREMARVGTLVVNKGMWRDDAGNPTRLISKKYMEAMSSPAFPEFNTGYGFLTWLNAKVDGTKYRAHCCSPRWSNSRTLTNQTGHDGVARRGTCCVARNGSKAAAPPCNLSAVPSLSEGSQMRNAKTYEASQYLASSIIDDNTPHGLPQAPHDLMMGQGLDGMYTFMIPSMNLTVVTMGNSKPSSTTCANGYDDAYLVALAWNAMAAAFAVNNQTGGAENASSSVNADLPSRASAAPKYDATSGSVSEGSDFPGGGGYGNPTRSVPKDAKIAGSCTCDCPSGLGYGRCFNVPASAMPANFSSTEQQSNKANICSHLRWNSSASQKIRSPSNYCPAIGETIGCEPATDTNASLLCEGTKWERWDKSVCHPVRECSPFPGMSPHFAVATCNCPVNAKAMTPCAWSPNACVYSPYYLPG